MLKQSIHDVDLRTALGRWSTGHGGERCRSHALNSSHLEAQLQRAQAAKLSALGTRVRRSRNTSAATRHTLVVDFYVLRKAQIDGRKGFADPTLALSKTCPKVIRETYPLERRSRPVAGVHRPIWTVTVNLSRLAASTSSTVRGIEAARKGYRMLRGRGTRDVVGVGLANLLGTGRVIYVTDH